MSSAMEKLSAPHLKYSRDQIKGWACVLCKARLYRTRPVGTIEVPTGYPGKTWTATLYACAGDCTPGGVL
jgi:hypothetical protein